ncbi:FadR family transcriptional regulator [Micrococcales bacterium 31B]|nr:FadR family transcriptional regulator [Micrococcales bacterium 31B]
MTDETAPRRLRRQTFDALAQHIVTGRLPAGHPLPSTAELCTQLGASRSVVREALSALEAVGLITIHNGRNAEVADLDGHLIALFLERAMQSQQQPYLSIMEVRGPLEIQSARLAAERIDPVERERLEALMQSLEEARQDAQRYPELDIQFHLEIARASNNSALLWFIETLRVKLAVSMAHVRDYRERHDLVGQEHAEHVEIARAILAGEVDAAVAAMEQHMSANLAILSELGI